MREFPGEGCFATMGKECGAMLRKSEENRCPMAFFGVAMCLEMVLEP